MQNLEMIVKELTEYATEEEWFEFKENWYEENGIGEYISSMSNVAALLGKENAYLVWGVNNDTHEFTGTTFTYHRDAIDMIMIFYSFMEGYFEEELNNSPQVKKIVDLGYVYKTDQGLYVLSEAGRDFFHEYIKDISDKYITFMKERGSEVKVSDVHEWYKKEFDLVSIKDAEDICEYIRKNLCHYGYGSGIIHSRTRGNLFSIEKI